MGKITLELNGLNLSKLLNELMSENVEFENIERIDYDQMNLTINQRNYKKIVKKTKILGINCEVINESGFHSVLLKLTRKLGIILGIIVVVITSLALSQSCFKINIEIEGKEENKQVLIQQIQQVLAEQKVGIGENIKNLNTRALEREFLKNVKNVSLAVVERNGVVINIFVKEAIEPDITTNANIIANYGGVIEDIKLKSGNLQVNVGDSVTKGQILITSGNIGDVFSEANGSIIARVLISGDSIGTEERVSYRRSGKVIEVGYVNLFGKDLRSTKTTDDDAKQFANFEIEKVETELSQFNIVPIKKIVYRYYELIEEFNKIEYTNLIEELSINAYNVAKSNMPLGAEELSVEYKTIKTEDYVKVICNIETRIDIATREK